MISQLCNANYPARYQETMLSGSVFRRRLSEIIKPGMAVLDVGAGNEPTLPPHQRPTGCHYVGLDVSEHELLRAPSGSYDELIVSDVSKRDERLEARFDLILSYSVFEHIKPLDAAVSNLHAYLRPDGTLIAQLSGRRTYFALLNRILPRKAKLLLLRKFHGVDKQDVFPAHYDRCYYRALGDMFGSWGSVDITSFHTGAGYLEKVPILPVIYLKIEDFLFEQNYHDYAATYVILAVR